jgi:hypothetical protein
LISKGPCLLGASFIVLYGSARFLALSQTFCPFVNLRVSVGCFCTAWLSAWVAIVLHSPNCLTHCLAKGLSDPSPCASIAGGSHLISNWLGVKLVVEFTKLLCTKVARGSRLLHSLSFPATNRRYCSSHWFFHSVSPSVWGWYAVVRFHSIPNSLARAFPKWLMNRGSLLDITLSGRPNQG